MKRLLLTLMLVLIVYTQSCRNKKESLYRISVEGSYLMVESEVKSYIINIRTVNKVMFMNDTIYVYSDDKVIAGVIDATYQDYFKIKELLVEALDGKKED